MKLIPVLAAAVLMTTCGYVGGLAQLSTSGQPEDRTFDDNGLHFQFISCHPIKDSVVGIQCDFEVKNKQNYDVVQTLIAGMYTKSNAVLANGLSYNSTGTKLSTLPSWDANGGTYVLKQLVNYTVSWRFNIPNNPKVARYIEFTIIGAGSSVNVHRLENVQLR